jgi:hypothetical protein
MTDEARAVAEIAKTGRGRDAQGTGEELQRRQIDDFPALDIATGNGVIRAPRRLGGIVTYTAEFREQN